MSLSSFSLSFPSPGFQVSDNTECGGEDIGLNGLGQSHSPSDYTYSSSGTSSSKKHFDSLEEKHGAAGDSRAVGRAQGARQEDSKAVDSLLISRLNCDSDSKASVDTYASRNSSSSSSSQSSHAARHEDKSGSGPGPSRGAGPGPKHGSTSEAKSSSNSNSNGNSSSNSSSTKGPGKKKEKEEDDLMDFLLDDSNF